MMLYAMLVGAWCLAGPVVPLAEQVGQMVMVGFRGTAVHNGDGIATAIARHHIGGVILYEDDLALGGGPRNIANPQQLHLLIQSLQKRAKTPLFVAVDQEGGHVRRLDERFGMPPSVSAEALGRRPAQDTHKVALAMAATLRRLGINVNLAPVVDLRLNPKGPAIGAQERSFAADPDIVVAHAMAFIQAHDIHRVLTVVKHFPGHGSAAGDTHDGLVDVTHQWRRIELKPFAELISKGAAHAVMTAHVFHRGLDPHAPATLSKAIVNGMLRRQLGFSGVVVSDSLQMGAIAGRYGLRTALRQAIHAGVDILLLGNNKQYDPTMGSKAVHTIMRLVQEGTISTKRIAASYRRIMALKSRYVTKNSMGAATP